MEETLRPLDLANPTRLKKIKIYVYLLIVVVLATVLRVYKLDQIPPSLNWDEVAAGYNAYTIANWGQDEWGQTLPLIFTSFRDDKHPVHIYTTALFVKLFGLSDFTTRLSAALFGVLSVVLIFFLAKQLFKSNLAAFFSSFLLAISPFDIHFSRGLWEINFALFYLMLGIFLFYLGLNRKSWWLALAFVSFIFSMMSYHSGKVVVPLVLITLIALYFNQLVKLREIFFVGLGIFLLFIMIMILDPRLAGLARVNQTQFSQEEMKKTQAFEKTHSLLLGYGEIVWNQYFKHFSTDFLYQRGDLNPRNSAKVLGEFYKFEAPFLIIGFLSLLLTKSRVMLVLLVWLAAAPLPASLVAGAPNASRALFMLGVFQLIEGLGIAASLNLIKNTKLKYCLGIVLIIVALLSLKEYTDYYFTKYSAKEAIEWQYGMKQVVDFVKKNPDYTRIYMTDVRSQPYIFFLYYLKYPLPKFLETVEYTQDKTKSYNTVYAFDKYQFGGWNEIQSMPDPGLVYVVEDSKYGGLAHKNDFVRVEKIKFPDDSVAFYIVSRY